MAPMASPRPPASLWAVLALVTFMVVAFAAHAGSRWVAPTVVGLGIGLALARAALVLCHRRGQHVLPLSSVGRGVAMAIALGGAAIVSASSLRTEELWLAVVLGALISLALSWPIAVGMRR
jgi:hypothetical protein